VRRFSLHDAKTHLSALVNAAERGAEIEITRYGKPRAKLVGVRARKKIALGLRKIDFQSDLCAPTDAEISELFWGSR
jgi:prevent-host-death family protein